MFKCVRLRKKNVTYNQKCIICKAVIRYTVKILKQKSRIERFNQNSQKRKQNVLPKK